MAAMKRFGILALMNTVLLGFGALVLASSSLSGTWMRNPELSDDPEEKVREAVTRVIDRANSRRRGGPSLDDPELRRRMEQSLDSLIQSAETLVIEQENDELQVDDGHGRIRIFYLDGQKHIRQTPGGASLETTCTVGGRYILVEQKMDGGVKINENYTLLQDGSRMELTVRLETKQLKEPLGVRSVYELES